MTENRNWFAEANVSEDLAAKDSSGGSHSLKGMGNHPAFGLSVAEDGRHIAPQHLRRVPVVKFSDKPEPEPREYVLEGLIPEGAATSLYGDGGVAKSMLAMSLSVSLAMGQEKWMGRKIQPQAVVYLDFELSADEQHRRAIALTRAAGESESIPDELSYMSALGYTSEEAFATAWEAFYDTGANLLVVDSVGLALQGEAENATDVIGWYRRYLDPFVSAGYAVLLIDHQSKGGDSYQRRTSFGSVYKRNLVRSEVQVEALDQDEDRGTLDLVFRQTKHNFGAKARPFGAQVAFAPGEIQVNILDLAPHRLAMEEGTKATDRVRLALSYLDGPVTAAAIAEETGMTQKTAQNAISQLKAIGEIRSTGDKKGRYELLEVVPKMPEAPRDLGTPDYVEEEGEEFDF